MANIPHVELSDTFEAQRTRINEVIDFTNANLPLVGGPGITVSSGNISVDKTGDGLEFDSNGRLVGNDAYPNLITQVVLNTSGTSPVPTTVTDDYIIFPEFDVIFDKQVYYGTKLSDFTRIHVPVTTMNVQAGENGAVYVYVDESGAIGQRMSIIDPTDSSTMCMLGSYFRIGNKLQPGSWKYTPWNGAASKDTRFAGSAAVSGGLISASGANTFTRNAISLVLEGVNASVNVYNPNRTEIEGENPYLTKAMWPGYNPAAASTTTLDTTHIFNMTSNTVDDISGRTGFIILVPGIVGPTGQDVYMMAMSPKSGNNYTQIYPDMNAARDAIYSYQLSLGNVASRVSWLGQTIIAKIGCDDYTDSTKLQVVGQIPNQLGSQTVSTGAGPGIEIQGLTIKLNGTTIGEASTKTNVNFSNDFSVLNSSQSEVQVDIVDQITPKMAAGITRISNDIKLEVDTNGKSWVRKGSKVYLLNGSSFTTDADVSIGRSGTTTDYVFVANNGSGGTVMSQISMSQVYTGPSAPTSFPGGSYMMWLDTSNWTWKYTNNSGASWTTTEMALPVGIVKNKNVAGEIDSIINIFNGMGYFGQVAFLLTGLKYLIPNGKNSDGTLKFTEKSINSVSKYYATGSSYFLCLNQYGNIQPWAGNKKYFHCETEPNHEGNTIWYDSNTNYIKYWDGTKWNLTNFVVAGRWIKNSNANATLMEAFNIFQFADESNTVSVNGEQEIYGNKTFREAYKNKPSATSSTTDTNIPTTGWVNDPNASTNVVHRSGYEVITDPKGFHTSSDVPIVIANTTDDSNVAPSTQKATTIGIEDKNGKWQGGFEHYHHPDGTMVAQLAVRKQNDSGENYAHLSVAIKPDGSTWTIAPTPNTNSWDTNIATTAFVKNVLNAIWPVGAIYLSITNYCPLNGIIGTWELIQAGRALWTGNGQTGNYSWTGDKVTAAHNVIWEGLPNVNDAGMARIWSPGGPWAWGAFSIEDSNYVGSGAWDSHIYPHSYTLSMNLYNGNSKYGSDRVQPEAYVVNVWRRVS